jgi:hypothetical protein
MYRWPVVDGCRRLRDPEESYTKVIHVYTPGLSNLLYLYTPR